MKASCAIRRWHVHSANVRADFGVPLNYTPWTSRRRVTLSGISETNARARDLIDVAWAVRLKQRQSEDLDVLAHNFFVDVSQSVHFKPWSEDGLRTFCKSSRIYSYEWDMLLGAKHQMAAMGFSLRIIDMLGPAKASCALVGQAFAVPSVATAVMACALNSHAPWWQ
jgi:hypothetical protein